MGGDGGSIPTRSELVKVKAKKARTDPNEQQRTRWSTCTLSGEALGGDVAADELGNLYNRETAISFILDKRSNEEKRDAPEFLHLRTNKDLLPLRLTPIGERPKMKIFSTEGVEEATFEARWVCPITFLEGNGKNRFFASRPCGCVVSERALKEVPSSACLACGKKTTGRILLVPSSEELDSLRSALLARVSKERERATPSSAGALIVSSSAVSNAENKKRALSVVQGEEETDPEEIKRMKEEKLLRERREKLASGTVGCLLPPGRPLSPPRPTDPSPLLSLDKAKRSRHDPPRPPPPPPAPLTRRGPPPLKIPKVAANSHLASLFSATLPKIS